jgi:hypothetical protein
MRVYFYILAGITSALIGWNIGQIFLTDLGLLKQFPEVVLFPCIAASLAIGMVLTEVLISSPTRPKLSLQIAVIPVMIAMGFGILSGLVTGGISQIVLLPQIRFDTRILRIVCWLLIGSSIGLAEGITWRWHSIEAGDRKRYRKRLLTSLTGSIIASLSAALIFEILRQIGAFPPAFKGIEDPVGFSILGMLLGFVFSISTSPSYMAALRAGAGFEYTGPKYEDFDPKANTNSKFYPRIDTSQLKFVSDSEADEIEEGLSIQLPTQGKIRIGSSEKANIRIPGLPKHAAELEIKTREAILVPNPKFYRTIEVNGDRLGSRRKIHLRHNYLLTFYPLDQNPFDDEKIYRFVYYNRFLDTQA